MRKLSFLVIFVASALQALPLVNPADSVMYTNGICWHQGENTGCFPTCDYDCWMDQFSMRLGFSGDYVFDRRIKLSHPESALASGSATSTKIVTNSGTFCLNFRDWIEAYVGFGSTSFSIKTSSVPLGNPTPIFSEIVFSPTTSYLVGAAAPILQQGDFLLGVQAQYFYAYPNANYFYLNSTGAPTYYNKDERAKYVDFQGAIAMSYNFEREMFSFVPFGGIQFSGLSWSLAKLDATILGIISGHEPTITNQQQVVGWTIGTSMYLCNRGGVTAEARFANEKALHVSGQLVF